MSKFHFYIQLAKNARWHEIVSSVNSINNALREAIRQATTWLIHVSLETHSTRYLSSTNGIELLTIELTYRYFILGYVNTSASNDFKPLVNPRARARVKESAIRVKETRKKKSPRCKRNQLIKLCAHSIRWIPWIFPGEGTSISRLGYSNYR